MTNQETEHLISIIIPIYNTKKYLEECLYSISAQSYRNIEIILVNDGSTDGSLEIAEKISNKDKRFKLISQKNSGVASARNNGVAHASGEYIIHADSDDILPTNAIAILYESAISENADIVLGDYIIKRKQSFEKIKLNFSGDHNTLLNSILTGEHQASLWNKLIRRSLYDLAKFEPGINFTEDKLFLSRLLARAKSIKISYVAKPVYIYRYRSGSYTTTFSKKSLNDLSATTEILCKELTQHYSAPLLDQLKTQTEALIIINTKKPPKEISTLKKIYSAHYISFSRRLLVWLVAHKIPIPLTIYKKIKAAITYIT